MNDFSALKTAISEDNAKVVQDLVMTGADVNVRDDSGQTPLFLAIWEDSLAIAKVLIDAGADVTIRDDNFSVLGAAKTPEMHHLLARAWPQDDPRRLHALAAADLADDVVESISSGADVNARDEEGQTPLFFAIWKDSLAAGEALIEAGADVTVRDADGQGTLDRRMSREMRVMLARAWPQDHPRKLYVLLAADLTSEFVCAISEGVNLNVSDEYGQTPLFSAIQRENLAAAEALVRAGADVTVRNGFGQSALDLARTPELCQLLARAWPQDHPLRLHALVTAGLADEVTDAAAAGADVNARDDEGWTPLFYAVQMDDLAATKALAEAGADVNARDQDGQTPLFLAAKNGNLAAADVLIKGGADAAVCDSDGRRAGDLARSPEMRQLLASAQ